jgi:DNA-directed RNA polymerase subunit RPC12/RpoP
MTMSAVSRKAPREEGIEEAKTIPMTVRASATIYEKLRVEADSRGVSVPALIIYQMGEWLRGGELDRKSPAGDPAERERRGEEAEAAELLYVCPGCDGRFPLDELVPDGVYLNCPGCEERSSIVKAEEPEDKYSPFTTTREGMREEPKVPEDLKCTTEPLIGDPCGWSGNKAAAAVTFNPMTRERAYSCPKCKAELAKARLFSPQDDVLACPDCKTAYRRDELKEATSWGIEWLVCPGEDCGGKIIQAVHSGKKSPTGKTGRNWKFPHEMEAAPPEAAPKAKAEKKTGRAWKLPIEG